MAEQRKVLIDCDPGHDDAVAILLALGNDLVDLRAITTVAGNQTLDKTTRNALAVCTIAGAEVPVAAGCDRPLIRDLRTGAEVHGESGLDGPELPEPSRTTVREHAVDVIIEHALDSKGDLTLVPVGPLTNIAMAVRREPRIVESVGEVVLMGGSYGRGNVTPAAEFNIYVDPEAASIVFSAGWPVTMVGLDLTHQALATPEVMGRIKSLETPVSTFVTESLLFYGHGSSPPVHDPCAVARVIAPELVTCVDAEVTVEAVGRYTAGMTVVDFDSPHPNAKVATTLDAPGFWDLVVGALSRIGSRR